MIFIDCVIYSLQKSGGITVYFNELIKRISLAYPASFLLSRDYVEAKRKWAGKDFFCPERYRDIDCDNYALCHSSYYRISQNKNVKNITTVHDFTYEKFVKGPARWVHSWQKFRAIRYSEAIICISENTKQDLLHYLPDVDQEKIFVIYNGVSDEYFPLDNQAAQVRKRYVLFVGARGGYKNFTLAINVIAQLKDIELLAVGGGQFSAKELLILNQLIPNRFSHAGFATTEQLNILYNEALCLLYPSSYEGFGIPIIEAMRAGCPVVAMNASSIPEVAGDAAILVDKPEVAGFVDAINSLCNKEKINELRELGFVQAAKFSWDETFRQTVAVYEHVLGHPLPKRIDE